MLLLRSWLQSEALIVSWLSPHRPRPVTFFFLLDPRYKFSLSCLCCLFAHDHLMDLMGISVCVCAVDTERESMFVCRPCSQSDSQLSLFLCVCV